MKARSAACAVLLAVMSLGASTLSAQGSIEGQTKKHGVATNGWSPTRRAAEKAVYAQQVAAGGPRYEYRYSIAGCDVGGGAGANSECLAQAVAACIDNAPAYGRGPLTDIWRRLVDQDGKLMLGGVVASAAQAAAAPGEGFTVIGATWLPQDMPGAAAVPSVEMIVRAFHLTRWAKGAISTQPAGDVTLVNLKTFYRVGWSQDGFEPGEVDTLDPGTMFGFRVDVRPKLNSLVYHFGDGQSWGPTTSQGGVYPDGDVVHTYRRPGRYATHVEATFGADFRINGGRWIELPDTATVRQPSTTVTVREARAVLVAR